MENQPSPKKYQPSPKITRNRKEWHYSLHFFRIQFVIWRIFYLFLFARKYEVFLPRELLAEFLVFSQQEVYTIIVGRDKCPDPDPERESGLLWIVKGEYKCLLLRGLLRRADRAARRSNKKERALWASAVPTTPEVMLQLMQKSLADSAKSLLTMLNTAGYASGPHVMANAAVQTAQEDPDKTPPEDDLARGDLMLAYWRDHMITWQFTKRPADAKYSYSL
jgi:hypothetical protein